MLTSSRTGETRTREEWASLLGITAGSLVRRLKRMSLDEALALPRWWHENPREREQREERDRTRAG